MKASTIALSCFTLTAAAWPGASAAQAPPHTAHDPPAAALIDRRVALTRAAAAGPGVATALAPRASAAQAEEMAGPFLRAPALTVFAGYRARAPVVGPELSVNLTQDVALRGLGDARRQAAAQLREAVHADVQQARLGAALRGVLAWASALEAKDVLRLRTLALAQAEAVAASTKARVASGVGQPRELALASGEVGTAHALVLEAEGTLFERLVALRHALGMAESDAVDVSGDLYASDDRAVDAKSALASVSEHPAMRTARARTELVAREGLLTRAQHGPTAMVGGSYAREATGEQIVGAIVGFPLAIVDPSRFEQARLRASEDGLRAHEARTLAELRRDVNLALHDREHWREVKEALRSRAIEPLREALRLAKKEYEVGTQDVAMVLLARQKVVGAEEQMARAAGAVVRSDAQLAYLTGALAAEIGRSP